ncbi:MAG: MFS transporter [Bacteroidetes bacterium GWF2_49_14]|nr:MAG: MFS transporter [Bacteroidetes bacterium GWF2_49_14]
MISTQSSTREMNKNFLLIVAMASHFFNPFMGAAVNVALKKIGSDFSMSAVGLSWVTMSYLLASAVFLVPFGRLGDTWGRTKMFLFGNIFFAVATLLCAFATNAAMLIAMRFLQGIAAAMMTGTTMALVISAFPAHQRGKVIGLNVSSVYVGSSLAPMIGGLITDTLSWRALFVINAVTSALIVLMILWKLRHEWSEPVREKFDFIGTIIYMLAVSMLMYGFSNLPETSAILLTLGGLTGLYIFAKVELKIASPVLNIRLFTGNRIFALANLSALINYAATFAMSFMLSLYLQYVKGMEAREAGLILVAQPVMMALVASFSGRLSDKMNPRVLAAVGMAISAMGLLTLSFIDADTTNMYIISGLIILGIGFGMFSSPNTNVVMSSVDKKAFGTASATVSTMRNTGMMFSMAIASLVIHSFLGDAKISIENLPQFILSTKLVFAIFTVLCFAGVFASLAKNKK